MITQRESSKVINKEAQVAEDEIKKKLIEKKQKLRSIMEAGEPPSKPPRQPALIKNGVALEMLAQIIQIEDKLCSSLPVLEVLPLDHQVLAILSGPQVVSGTPDDGAPNQVFYPALPSSSPPLSSPAATSSPGIDPFLAACSLSTYPHVNGTGPERQGDPVCDRFCVHLHKNGAIVALADGCNWGRLPFEAANRATTGFIQYLEERSTSVISVRGVGSLLLAALSAADKKITEGLEKWEAGTTTLIGGLLLQLATPSSSTPPSTSHLLHPHAPPLSSMPRSSSWSSLSATSLPSPSSPSPSPSSSGRTRAGSTSLTAGGKAQTPSQSQWVFVCASLGDCKAFHYSQRTQIFTDITEGNRQNLTDARDPGGRLGPYIDDGPDLRNLHLYYHTAEPDDIIFIMSDGVHDNLDPQQLGISPSEAKIEASTWEEAEKVDPASVEVFKNNFRKKWLEDTFTKQLLLLDKDIPPNSNHKTKLDVKLIVDVLLQHCVNITKSSREFMENNPKQKQPHDFKAYPGKLDHATCVCLRVGANTS
jgi:hypothetical protein